MQSSRGYFFAWSHNSVERHLFWTCQIVPFYTTTGINQGFFFFFFYTLVSDPPHSAKSAKWQISLIHNERSLLRRQKDKRQNSLPSPFACKDRKWERNCLPSIWDVWRWPACSREGLWSDGLARKDHDILCNELSSTRRKQAAQRRGKKGTKRKTDRSGI